MKEKQKHYLLSFSRRKSGAFEHAWGLAKNFDKKDYEIKYYSCWWDPPVFEVNLKTEETTPVNIDSLKNLNGIIHLHTHTWEYGGLLDIIRKNTQNTLIYSLHAVIPYYHMKEKDKISLLRGELSPSAIHEIVKNLSQRERSQLTAIPKMDHIFTISKKHKSILEMMDVKKPIHVFENVTDFHNIPGETIAKAYGEGKKFKESLGTQNLILYCGRLYPKKGSLGLFDSFKKIRKEYPSTRMVLLGANEEMAKEMISYGLDEESLKHTSFVPWIVRSNEDESKFLNYFLASDVLIQPMITPELYSRAVIDAMALGIPAISCESPYTIGSSQNSQAIFESFVKIKENQKEVEKIVQKAKEKIKRENTWDSYISRLEKIISV